MKTRLQDQHRDRIVPFSHSSCADCQKSFTPCLPDLHLTIDDLIAEGDKVVFRITVRGTHQGAFMGVSPTGKSVTVTAIDIARFADGKIVEHWGQMDSLGLMQQLGVVPVPGLASS